jgi:hypothetical protein
VPSSLHRAVDRIRELFVASVPDAIGERAEPKVGVVDNARTDENDISGRCVFAKRFCQVLPCGTPMSAARSIACNVSLTFSSTVSGSA